MFNPHRVRIKVALPGQALVHMQQGKARDASSDDIPTASGLLAPALGRHCGSCATSDRPPLRATGRRQKAGRRTHHGSRGLLLPGEERLGPRSCLADGATRTEVLSAPAGSMGRQWAATGRKQSRSLDLSQGLEAQLRARSTIRFHLAASAGISAFNAFWPTTSGTITWRSQNALNSAV